MARIRTIKPEFWTDEKIVGLPALARLLFIGLWNFCDDHGYLWDEPLRIKLQVLPMDECNIPALLTLLIEANLLTELETTTGKRAFLITHFKDHQKVQHPADSKIQPLISRILMNPHESSRVLTPEWNGKEGKGIEGNGKERKGGGVVSPSAQEPPEADSPPVPDQAQEIFDTWNGTEGVLKAEKFTAKRRAAVNARLRESYFRSNWTAGLAGVASSAFCQGSNDRGWKADLDWFLRPETLVKILEGKYANNTRAGPSNGSDLFGGLREFVQSGGSS